MSRNLNKISRDYARAIKPSIMRGGLKMASIAFAGVLGVEALGAFCSLRKYSREYGIDFNKEWKRDVHENFTRWIMGPLAFAVIFFGLAGLEFMGAKEEFKKYALTVMKRYVHGTQSINESVLRDVTDLVVANMSQLDRAKVICIALDLESQLCEIGPLKEDEIKRAMAKAESEATEVITGVFRKNPNLMDLVCEILLGKTKYNPKLFIQARQH